MKAVKLILTGLFLALFTVFAFANPNDDSDKLIMRVEASDAKILHITLANLQQVTTNLMLRDLNGEVYYYDTVRKHNGYGKNLSLKNLPRGRYLLTVSQKDSSVEWTSVILVEEREMFVSQAVEK